MEIVTQDRLREWIESGKNFTLIDVREPAERAEFNIGGFHLPMGELRSRWKELEDLPKPFVLYCAKGIRSAIAIQWLESMGVTGLCNLQSGVYGWPKGGRAEDAAVSYDKASPSASRF